MGSNINCKLILSNISQMLTDTVAKSSSCFTNIHAKIASTNDVLLYMHNYLYIFVFFVFLHVRFCLGLIVTSQ